jgi:hypothetical protein
VDQDGDVIDILIQPRRDGLRADWNCLVMIQTLGGKSKCVEQRRCEGVVVSHRACVGRVFISGGGAVTSDAGVTPDDPNGNG